MFTEHPACPNCARAMNALEAGARPHGRPALKAYRCDPCGFLFSEVLPAQHLLTPDRALVLNFEAGNRPH